MTKTTIKAENPLVCIIIVDWNGLQYTGRCLESLQRLRYPNFKTIVVDNGSKKLESEILKELYPTLIETVRLKRNIGFAGANNVGIRHALKEGADYTFLLNNDTVIDPLVLQEMIVFADKNPKIGIVGPKVFEIRNGKRTNMIQSFGAKINLYRGKTPLIGGQVDQGQFAEPLSVDFVSGCAMLIKRNVIEEIGFLNTRYFMYLEDVDYCLRARRRGFQVWAVPAAAIWHRGAQSSTDIQRLHYRIASLIIFARIHTPKLGLFLSILYLVFVRIPVLSARLFFEKPLETTVMVIKAVRKGFSS